jgi:hypothetical protein
MQTTETEMAILAPAIAGPRTAESAASWSAIVAGAVAAAALSLILLALGTGLGLSSVSPWALEREGASAQAIGYATAAWLLATAALASGLGGYLTGRLRTKWTEVDADEAHFRDTAHGFLAWAAATVVTAAVLTSAATSLVGTAANVAGTGLAAAGAGTAAAVSGATDDSNDDYFVDLMLRRTGAEEAGPAIADTKREVAGIMSRSLVAGELSAGDRSYLAQLLASRNGLSAAEAEQRVTQVAAAARLAADAAQAKALAAADAARSAGAKTALWIFAAFLVGAFSASLAATWGGRRRDAPIRYRSITQRT